MTDEAGLEALAGEWDGLLESSGQQVFFLRHLWNRLWWRFLRPAASELFIVTCRDERGSLAGLAPFYLRQRRTAGIPYLREVLFLGTGVYAQTSEYLDVIARRGCERAVAEAIAACLSRNNDWDRISLTEVPNTSNMLRCLQGAFSEQTQIELCGRAYFIDTTVDWETFRKGLGGSARRNAGSGTRKLFNAHHCKLHRVHTADQLDPAMDSLVQLHQARWQSKGQPGAFALPNVEQFLREAARASLAEGRLSLLTFEVDGKVAAARLDFLDNHVAHAFQGGFDPAYANEALGAVMNGLCVKTYIEDEWVHAYDLMGGSGEYKESWTRLYRDSVSMTLVRPGARSAPYRSFERAIAVGKSLVRATIPESLRLAGHRLITQRHYK